ncbi:MAG: PDZ domain-containing protein [Gemmataceae bacterium]|nr:PDZ domain-containing protein [Gemmataceae bacterium]
MPRPTPAVWLALCAAALLAGAAPVPVAPPPREAPDPLAAGRAFAAAGKVDRFVATTAGWKLLADDPRLWRPVFDLAGRLVDKSAGPDPWLPRDRVTAFAAAADRRELPEDTIAVRSDHPHRQRERDVFGRQQPSSPEWVIAPALSSPLSMRRTAAVARGPVRVPFAFLDSIVLTNGDITVGPGATAGVIVVADGDIEVGDGLEDSLVIARGDVRVKKGVVRSTVVAGGRVAVGNAGDTLPVPFKPVIVGNEPNPFGFVSWFELSQVGVAGEAADGGVAVTRVVAGRPFAAAGVRKGDLVVKVREHPVGTPEEFRRRVRDAHALTAEAVVHLRRDGQPFTVRVPLPH